MKKVLILILAFVFAGHFTMAQQRISKNEISQLKKHLADNPLLQEGDEDFKSNNAVEKWSAESAVILCQKTTFDFDKKGLSAGKRVGRNLLGILFALPTFGSSIFWANANNETRILVEETERRKILLKDKYALEQYSVLYFRLAAEGDAFSARVIKKDNSVHPVDLAEAIRVEDIRSVPGVFRSYTDQKFSSYYHPDYFKIAVPDLEEGDIVEYEFINFNTQKYFDNPSYKEFAPVYYLCNRDMPVAKQVIEVVTEDDKYHIGYKNLKGAPEFVQTMSKGKKTYRWVDSDRDKMVDTRYVNELIEMPSLKFQVIYARNSGRNFIWFSSEEDMKKDMTNEELADKIKTFWFNPEKLQSTGDYTAGLRSSIENTTNNIFKSLKKKGVVEAGDEDYVRKAYYHIRGNTLYGSWSDFAFAKVFSGLLTRKRIPHEIVVSTSNFRTSMAKIAFTQEVAWVIKYKNKYYCNPGEHLNPEEIPEGLAGNQALRFDYKDAASSAISEVLPMPDTTENVMLTLIKASLDSQKVNISVDKTVESRGLLKNDNIDDVLAMTPYMESDYRNFDGMSMWEGLTSAQEEKAMSEFAQQKKEWKEEKPKMMKYLAESEYNGTVEKYDNFKLINDGRNYKKKSLRYSENFVLGDLSATAGNDLVVAAGAFITEQSKIKKEERNRTLPIDVRYPRTFRWKIYLTIPTGYTAKGIESLNRNVSNECGSFVSTAKVENDQIVLEVKKSYHGQKFDIAQWTKLLEVLDAAHDFSQSKVIFRKN